MGAVSEYILEVRVEVDPEREDDWNRWYNEVHVPAVLACPGIRNAKRYRAVLGKPKYTALYDIDDEKVLQSPEMKAILGWGEFEPHIKNAQACVYKKFLDIGNS